MLAPLPLPVPNPFVVGDVVGLQFPNTTPDRPHPALILDVLVGQSRTNYLKKRVILDKPAKQLVFALMISHEPPKQKGCYFQVYNPAHCAGTLLDTSKTIYVSYNHFDAVFLPGDERKIHSAEGPYLGRASQQTVDYYFRQLMGVQKVIRGVGYMLGSQFSLPPGVQRS